MTTETGSETTGPTYWWKQVLVVRKDLDMRTGKIAGQCAHAAVDAVEVADERALRAWKADGRTKIVLKVGSEAELLAVADRATAAGLPVALVYDAGRTQIDPDTLTAAGIGPAEGDRIDAVVGDLKLL